MIEVQLDFKIKNSKMINHFFCFCIIISICSGSQIKNVQPSIVTSTTSTSTSIQMPSVRPLSKDRLFVSTVIDDAILDVSSRMVDRDLAILFENCYPNTLDTTVYYQANGSNPDTFVITGDIIAMWLRDSSAQVSPYLRFASQDAKLKDMIVGVLNRQTKQVTFDPYANAHHRGQEGRQWLSDSTTKLGFLNIQLNAMVVELHERKYELDSLVYFLKLATSIYELSPSNSSIYFGEDFQVAVEIVLNVITTMQASTLEHKEANAIPYTFYRETSRATDTLLHGVGHPGRRTGMSRSPFRPSDDATTYPFLVPSNAFAVVQLRKMINLLNSSDRSDLATRCNELANEIEEGIYQHAIYNHPVYGNIFAWEVDGFGNYYLGDDANVPSVLSLPYLGFVSHDDVIYQNTRRFILSDDNPWMNRGSVAEGFI